MRHFIGTDLGDKKSGDKQTELEEYSRDYIRITEVTT